MNRIEIGSNLIKGTLRSWDSNLILISKKQQFLSEGANFEKLINLTLIGLEM